MEHVVMSSRLKSRRELFAAFCASNAVLLFGCAVEKGTEEPLEPPTTENPIGAVGASIEFPLCPQDRPCGLDVNVSLKVIGCAAELLCKESMLRDDAAGGAPGPTLIASFSCDFPENAPPQDAIMSLNPSLRCYTDGDLADPSTWLPVGGLSPAFGPGQRLAFSQEVNGKGRVFTSRSWLMSPMKAVIAPALGDEGFCVLDAWGDVVFSDLEVGEPADATCLVTDPGCARRRDPSHIRWAPAVHWRGVVEWTGAGWDCHSDGTAPLTVVQRKVVEAAVHDTPDPYAKGDFPVLQSYGLIDVEPHLFGGALVDTLVVRFADDAEFPEAPMAAPVEMTRRLLQVESAGLPLGVEVVRSCSQNNSIRELQRVGVLLADKLSGEMLGAVVIHKSLPGSPSVHWDCERSSANEPCPLLGEADYLAATPCLGGP